MRSGDRRAWGGVALAAMLGAGSACDLVAGIDDRTLTGSGGGGSAPTCDGGAQPCTSDRADCDGCPTNGCEVDLRGDPSNCGRCERSCGGQSCGFGSCEPEEIVVDHDFGPFVYGMATDATQVYLGEGGYIRAAAKDGSMPLALLCAGPESTGVTVHAERVYWAGLYGAISAVPIHGGAVIPLGMSTIPFLNGIAVDETSVYLTSHDAAQGFIASMPIAGGQLHLLHGGGVHFSPNPDGEWVFFAYGDVWRVRKDGTAATPITAGVNTGQLAVDATHVYYAWAQGIERVPKTGGQSETVVPDQPDVRGFAMDADRLYWRDGRTGDIFEANKDGSGLLRLAQTQVYGMAGAAGFTTDSDYVYWLLGPLNHLYRTPK